MDKRYQVFVSSTFKDLKDERSIVNKAILDMGHIPSGMETFPASPKTQMDYIKQVIDNCDYYILIIGGKYGSTDESGLSFTEQEFEYAISKKVPVLAFVYNNLGELKASKVELDETQRAKLETFRGRVLKGRVVNLWNNGDELSAKVIVSLNEQFRENPRIGWRRDDDTIPAKIADRLNQAKLSSEFWSKQYSEAKGKIDGYENLERSEIEIRYTDQTGSRSVSVQSALIIKEFAFKLQQGLDSEDIERGLYSLVEHRYSSTVGKLDKSSIDNVKLFFEVFEIAEEEGETLYIRDDKKWLLKAAFMPIDKIIPTPTTYGDLDDEIPF